MAVYTRADFLVSNMDLIKAGKADETVPPIVTCEYCGKELPTMGLRSSPSGGEGLAPWQGILWKGDYAGYGKPIRYSPVRCTCDKAKAFWCAYDAAREEERKELKKRQDEERRQAMVRRLVSQSGLEGNFPEHMTLKNFSKPDPGTPEFHALREAAWWVANYKDRQAGDQSGQGVYFEGAPGTGKTHLAVAMCRKLMETGVPTMAVKASDLFARLRSTYNEGSLEFEQQVLTIYSEIDVLMIDDLGHDRASDWSLSKLLVIVDKRLARHNPTIVTVNYTQDELAKRLTPQGSDSKAARAIISRLAANSEVVNCGTTDHRRIKR